MASDDDTPRAVAAPRPHKTFSARLAREICLRTMAGESQASICADPAMPCEGTLWRWTKKHPEFARIFARARALGEREGSGRRNYCPVTAHEIAARVSEGESLTAIGRDPAMPSLSTIFRWRHHEPAFDEALMIAKAVMAERFADMGWTLAMEATPETAYLTQVRLKQLRWTAAIMSPGTHGRLKASDPPEPPQTQTVSLRTFATEICPETGRVRGVAIHFDPERGEVVRDSVGEWRDPPFPLRRGIDYAAAKQARLEQGLPTETDPSTWG